MSHAAGHSGAMFMILLTNYALLTSAGLI